LRHFISNPEPDILYYASSRDIFALDTTTGERTHITCLPFWARCTAAGYGYICAGGGDSGHFAVVTLNHTNGIANPDTLGWQRSRPPSVQVEQAGQEIVNSISIHKLEGREDFGTLDDVVAVLTNNDKTIRIFSLTQHTQNTVLELRFPCNHATISPDGRTLVCVGDYQEANFYGRVDLAPSAESKSNKYASSHIMWELLKTVALHVPTSITTTGYFTTAWSPSGNLCAVASECGYVSVIDMEALQAFDDAEDAIVAVMASTRPENVHPSGAIPGAIRTMVFAPHPWDLLIWAEDQGKICLADLRSGLRVRQIVRLEPDHEGYQRVDMDINSADVYSRRGDAELEREYIRNFRTYRSLADESSGTFDIDDELVMAEARTLAEGRSMARAALRLADDTQLSRQERELLDSLRTTAQADDRASLSPNPRSIHYAELANESRRSTAQQSSLFAQDFPALARQNEESSASTSTLPTTFRIMRDYMRDRTREYQNAAAATPSHRRTYVSSRDPQLDDIVGTTSLSAMLGNNPSSTSTTSDPQAPTLSDRASLFQGDLTRSSASRLLSTLRASPHSTTSPSPTDIPDPADTRRRRAILRARERALASSSATTTATATATVTAANPPTMDPARHHRLAGLMTRGDYYDPALGLRTAGLAISKDGRRLWAACDKGIFEFEINVRARMGMAAVEFK
jgi:hypothetical protein